ncbi:general secretion pathway protein GspB [Piscinibacter sp.]|uniref:general secretion pathway protein GspB n=1 Tax=Piscinibacter sp. TaxID=1903157 RepID=UPI002C5F816E|nr:general secretion pathway protein GspB [Albitalea sp.]HUG23075.1 general secretion pathway protein GspB [Albitalea sp.]
MSYILDALRRADSERARGSVPNIHAQPAPPVASDAKPQHKAAWIVVGVSLGLMVPLAWHLLAADDPAVAVAAVPEPPATPAPRPAPPPAPAPIEAPAAAVPAYAEPPAPAPAAESRIYALNELPDHIRRELPKLTIGGSTYSENPASRFLIVNGQLFREKDTLSRNLSLEEIKLKDAVLKYKGYRYAITY